MLEAAAAQGHINEVGALAHPRMVGSFFCDVVGVRERVELALDGGSREAAPARLDDTQGQPKRVDVREEGAPLRFDGRQDATRRRGRQYGLGSTPRQWDDPHKE